jgi:hypothetical protein
LGSLDRQPAGLQAAKGVLAITEQKSNMFGSGTQGEPPSLETIYLQQGGAERSFPYALY